MNAPEFIRKVQEMRDAQKRYFRQRDNLDACKALEREVDKAIDAILAPPNLFQQTEESGK